MAAAPSVVTWRRHVLALATGDTAAVGAGVMAGAGGLADARGGLLAAALGLSAVWLAALATGRAYGPSVVGTGAAEYRRVARAGLHLLAVAGAAAYFLGLHVGPGAVALAAAVTTVASVAVRAVAARWLRRQREAGRFVERLIVAGPEPAVLGAVSRLAATAGARVVGVSFAGAGETVEAGGMALPACGAPDDVAAFARRFSADGVVVTGSADVAIPSLRRLAWQLEGTGVRLLLAVDVGDLHHARLAVRQATGDGGLPLIEYAHPEFHGWRRVVKSGIDRVVAGAAAVVLAPVFGLITVAVLVADGRPVLFRQVRVGLGGRRFAMWKFRTMVVNAEDLRTDLLPHNDVDGLLFKMHQDPRVTKMGRFLRRWSLDELPQLWNVLAGDMSLVGPRPPLPCEVEAYGDDARRRLLVRPGITGLWQVSGRSSLSWEESVRLDLEYVQNWSPTLDTGILARTVVAVVRGKGAY